MENCSGTPRPPPPNSGALHLLLPTGWYECYHCGRARGRLARLRARAPAPDAPAGRRWRCEPVVPSHGAVRRASCQGGGRHILHPARVLPPWWRCARHCEPVVGGDVGGAAPLTAHGSWSVSGRRHGAVRTRTHRGARSGEVPRVGRGGFSGEQTSR